MKYTGKRIMVLGMARSGVAAAKLLLRLGATVLLSDSKDKERLGDVLPPEGERCLYCLGQPPQAFYDGLDMLVISPGVPVDAPVVLDAKKCGIPVIGELELGAQVTRGTLLAITGTNGKTTTTTLLGEICAAAGKDTHVVGNIGYPITERCDETTDASVTVAEVSSFQCETMETFRPHVGAILNIREDHLNRHGDMETYIALKKGMLTRQSGEDIAVLNADDAVCRAMAEDLHAQVAYFSRTSQVQKGACVEDGKIVLHMHGKVQAVCRVDELRIPGPHNLENALAAAVMASAIGVDVDAIARVLKTFRGVEHRMETVRVVHGVTWINDSKGTNVDSTLKAIESMLAPTVIILGGSDKQVDFSPLAKAIAATPFIKHAVLMGETAGQIKQALHAEGFIDTHEAGSDFERCLSTATQLAQEGWNVLFSPACASFDMFRDFEHRGAEYKRLVNRIQ